MKLGRWLTFGTAAAGGYMLVKQQARKRRPALALDGCVVLITGASSGIGAALAHEFAKHGVKLVLAARRIEQLESLRQELAPTECLVVPTDVSDSAQLQALVDKAIEHFGQIDILINNAGVEASGPLYTMSQETIRRTIDINVSSVIGLTSLVLPGMMARGSGYIINMSSIAGSIAQPYFGPYTVSKHAVNSFSKSLRREVDGTGIKVMTVSPSWTRSEMVPPALERRLKAMGYRVYSASEVAAQTVDGLYEGRENVYFGEPLARLGILADQYAPFIVTLFLRRIVSPEYIAFTRQGWRE
jgi:short-subunit dehydrogenase